MREYILKRLFQLRNHLTQTQFIAYGFLLVILTGTFLLMLPISSRTGGWTSFLNSMFTATSATCVTGLVVYDTWTHWSVFGQIVILMLIQIGGLGFISMGVFLSIILRRKIGLKERGLLQESINALQIGGIVRLTRKIVWGTALVEGVGALLLSIRFIPEFGLIRGIYYGIFHSVSAFCNAGFDLMGRTEAYSSLTKYYNDWLVNLVIMSLIVIGGIGFLVWDDMTTNGIHFRKYRLHTKLVLIVTSILLFGGAGLFYLFEKHNLMAGMTPGAAFLTSMFSSVTARTAGFNTIDTMGLTDASKFLTSILMFIGGSPGSTAGGVKTTTIAVLYLYLFSNIRRTDGVNAFGRRLEDDVLKDAASIFILNLTLALAASVFIMGRQGLPMSDIFFETMSAIGTVGMSTGITRALCTSSRVFIIFLMYCGRVGGLSFALSFTQHRKVVHLKQPAEAIRIG